MSATIDNRKLEFFPQSFMDLQRELPNHPELVEHLQNHPADELELRLAEIASYCGVVLDGSYLPEELHKLAEILVKRLIAGRGGVSIIEGNVQ